MYHCLFATFAFPVSPRPLQAKDMSPWMSRGAAFSSNLSAFTTGLRGANNVEVLRQQQLKQQNLKNNLRGLVDVMFGQNQGKLGIHDTT